MRNTAHSFELDCDDPEDLLEAAHAANNTTPRWREGFDSVSGLLTIFGIGLLLSSSWFFPWLSQKNTYALMGGVGLLTAGIINRGKIIEFRLWGVVVDESLRSLDGSYWMRSKAIEPEEILEWYQEYFPDSKVCLVDLGYHKQYVSKNDLELIARRNLADR